MNLGAGHRGCTAYLPLSIKGLVIERHLVGGHDRGCQSQGATQSHPLKGPISDTNILTRQTLCCTKYQGAKAFFSQPRVGMSLSGRACTHYIKARLIREGSKSSKEKDSFCFTALTSPRNAGFFHEKCQKKSLPNCGCCFAPRNLIIKAFLFGPPHIPIRYCGLYLVLFASFPKETCGKVTQLNGLLR